MTPDPDADEPGFQEEVQKQTQVLLEACRANKVKRLVLTCTVTNITEVEDKMEKFTEASWSNPDLLDAMDPFLKAKLL